MYRTHNDGPVIFECGVIRGEKYGCKKKKSCCINNKKTQKNNCFNNKKKEKTLILF